MIYDRMLHGWSFWGAFGCAQLLVCVGWMFGALLLAPANTQAQGTFTSDFEWNDASWRYARFFERSLEDSTRTHPWMKRGTGLTDLQASRWFSAGSGNRTNYTGANRIATTDVVGERSERGGLPEELQLRVFWPRVRVTYNDQYAGGFNDGAMWQGRGLNYSYTTGVAARWHGFHVQARPEMIASENKFFKLSPHTQLNDISKFGMARQPIDMPQRFGDDPISVLDPGESFVRYEYGDWMGGISNQKYWTGPAMLNPLIFSHNAPGFAHAFVGSRNPVSIPSGSLQTRMLWGGIRESDFFDSNPSNNMRFISSFMMAYHPDWIPGLTIGYTRTGYKYLFNNEVTLSALLLPFWARMERSERTPQPIDFYDHYNLMSAFSLRYALPESGFEWYLEWGRNDLRRTLRDIISEPELNRAYTVGIIKRWDLHARHAIVTNIELTQLENNSPGAYHRMSTRLIENEALTWYSSQYIRQGYTHKGQVIGAWIGPGSSAQTLSMHWYHPWGMLGGSVGRTVFYNDRLFWQWDYYLRQQTSAFNGPRKLHEVEMHYGVSAVFLLPLNLVLQADYRLGKLENQFNVLERDRELTNWSFTLRYGF
jgi:hypothetical protein